MLNIFAVIMYKEILLFVNLYIKNETALVIS